MLLYLPTSKKKKCFLSNFTYIAKLKSRDKGSVKYFSLEKDSTDKVRKTLP